MEYSFFANCPKLVEGLLADELRELGATKCKETLTGVYFTATLASAYRMCLWSRLANHILLQLATIDVTDIASIHKGVSRIDWSKHFSANQSFKIDFSGLSSLIQNTQYGAQVVKDAIVDQFRSRGGDRPSVALNDPDIRIHAHLYGDKLTLSLDLSGESLHKRGYRQDTHTEAPMKENLAAALLIRCKWSSTWQNYTYFMDPMCGSGTLLIEAALMASDTAPGLLREKFGFSTWRGHEPAIWKTLLTEAIERRKIGMSQHLPDIRGFDASPRTVVTARENIERAGLEKWLDVSVRELSHLTAPTHHGNKPGLLMTNPPYGERLGDEASLKPLYQHFGARLREQFQGWEVALFLGNLELGKAMRIRSYKSYAFFNGTIPCKLLLMKIIPEWFMREREVEAPVESAPRVLSEEAQMFANRLRKNLKALKPWVTKNNIHAYRIYDADMPEYAVAIDCYNDWAHVQEYAAPKTVNAEKAAERLKQICNAIPMVLEIPPHHIVIKERKQQKDHSQYEKINAKGETLTVQEGDCKLLVNLHDYLDTGLFLDHRPIRLYLANHAKGKRLLNLYCYTGSVTVQAAMGGARSSVSVDMSATYTHWARRNLSLNGLSVTLHRVVQADCWPWLENNKEKFDIIFLDPPTFSRSKRMDTDFDIQRDHVDLIRECMRHLADEGVLYFSNNFRKFKLDEQALSDLTIKDITAQTIDKDFQRDPKIHCCFLITAR